MSAFGRLADRGIRLPSPPPGTYTHNGQLWLIWPHAANRKRGSLTSDIWQLGQDYISAADRNVHAWRCGLCKGPNVAFIPLPRNSTSNPGRHLKRVHHRKLVKTRREGQEEEEEEEAEDRLLYRNSTVTPSSTAPETVIDNRATTPKITQLTQSVNIEAFRRSLMRWIVKQHIPFLAIEDDDFRAILVELNQSVAGYLVSADTIRNWVRNDFHFATVLVKGYLASALSRIHISFDLWTSPNGLAICGVCAHFVGPDNRNRSLLIGMKRMQFSHDGESIAGVAVPVLQEYEILGEKIGVFVADNAVSNDTAIAEILRVLRPDVVNVNSRRGRCLAHIINLAAQVFIFGRDMSAFEDAVGAVDESTPLDSAAMKKAQDAWRKKDPVGKLHNIVVAIRASPQRREEFKACTVGNPDIDDLLPHLDNSTRWNSTYDSITLAIRLKPRIQLFCVNHERYVPKDTLSAADWERLEGLEAALLPFKLATKKVEGLAQNGHHGAVWEVLPIIEALLAMLESKFNGLQANGQQASPLGVAYQNSWQKLQKYYNLADSSLGIFAAAILLHPTYRKHYFEERWTARGMQEWKPILYRQVQQVWENEYRGFEGYIPEPVKTTELDFLEAYLTGSQTPIQTDNVFDSFISGNPIMIDRDSVIAWWTDPANRYKAMRQMALDLFSVPATSAELEREFSSAKRLITPTRNRLNDDTIEEVELLRNWWRQGIGK